MQRFILLLSFIISCHAYAFPAKQTDLQQQLKTNEIQLGKLSQQMTVLNQQLTEQNVELKKLKETQQVFLMQLATQQKALSQQIKLIYQLGQIQSLKTLLNPDDVNMINRHLFYYHYLSEARLRLVDEIKKSLNTISNNIVVISNHEQTLKKLLEEKEQQQQQQKFFRVKRQQIVTQLHLKLQNKQQQIAASAANQRTLQKTLFSLNPQTITFTNRTFNQLHGKLQWPVRGTIITSFGSWLNNQRSSGIIIKAPEGTSVHAISGGRVVFASWLRGFGLLVIINHGNGYMSLYARNHTLLAKVGDIVKPRDMIATIGNSGGYNKASLYFEIRQNGTPINPRSWCR